jgi:myo-inositol-1(or 4)-monophosphatase
MRLLPETRAAVGAALAAGRLLLWHAARPRPVRLKAPRDPVTVADGASERCIRRLLGRRFPAIGFLGEEGTVVEGREGRWIVDPLDGTIAFVAGLPTFAVSIALERRGSLEVGVLLFPRLGELFVAERGQGAWLGGRRLHVSAHRTLQHGVVSLWHDASVWGNRALRERLARVGRAARSIVCHGACYSLAGVAAGRLDGYWEQSAHPWDVAAGALLVREAGGRVSDGAGGPFRVESPTIIASNGRVHRRLVALLRSRGRRGGPRLTGRATPS